MTFPNIFSQIWDITKTCLYNFDPHKPHFYIVKLGFTGVYLCFLISAQKHRLWVLLRTAAPRRFLLVPTFYVLSRNEKNQNFLSENFHFLVVKFSVYLNRHVFVINVFPVMLHTLFQFNRPCSLGDKTIFMFYYKWSWWPSWVLRMLYTQKPISYSFRTFP